MAFCAAADSVGRYATSNSAGGTVAWTQVFPDSAEIRDVGIVNFSVDGVACPSATLCLAVDSS